MANFVSVPFKTESGLSHINGVAKFSGAGVVLEFESKLFGLLPGGVKEVRVPLGDILDVKFRKGFFKRGAKIEIRTKTFAKLAELPAKTASSRSSSSQTTSNERKRPSKDCNETSPITPPSSPHRIHRSVNSSTTAKMKLGV